MTVLAQTKTNYVPEPLTAAFISPAASENDQFILRNERPRLVSRIRDFFMLLPFSKRISPSAMASSQIERWGQLRRQASASE
jgi:hypothetical protein